MRPSGETKASGTYQPGDEDALDPAISGSSGAKTARSGRGSYPMGSDMRAARYAVQIARPSDGRVAIWDTFDDRPAAEAVVSKLRRHGFFAQVRKLEPAPAVPSKERPCPARS